MDVINLFALFVGVAILYFSWRKASHKNLETDFKLKIYKLRDDLRQLAIEGQLDCESFAFKYFDKALSRVACDSYYISLPYMFFMELKNKGNHNEMDELHASLNAACDELPAIKTIRDEMSIAIWHYVKDQHKYSVLHGAMVLVYFVSKRVAAVNTLRRKYNRSSLVDSIIYYPIKVSSHSGYEAIA